MIKWPSLLIESIARRRCVLFLGSGVSMNSTGSSGKRPKSWIGFLEHGATLVESSKDRTLIKKLIKERDLLTACEVLKKSLRTDDFTQLMEEEFLIPAYKKAEIHEHIFSLDSRIVLTPNFDKIYETHANQISSGTVKVKNYYATDLASDIRGKGRVIIKTHGTIEQQPDLIFSRANYAQARSKHRDFYKQLEALIITHTFIFIGCGLDDPDIRLLLEDHAHKFSFSKNHYFINKKNTTPEKIKSIILDTMKLEVLEYSGKTNDHSKLTESLKDLVASVEAKRIEIASNQDW